MKLHIIDQVVEINAHEVGKLHFQVEEAPAGTEESATVATEATPVEATNPPSNPAPETVAPTVDAPADPAPAQ